MQIRVRHTDEGVVAETFDPAMNDNEGGVCREVSLAEGQEVVFTLTTADSVEDIAVGEVTDIAPEEEPDTVEPTGEQEEPGADPPC